MRVLDDAAPARSWSSRLGARIGNPVNWSIADKALLIGVGVLPFTAWHTAILMHAARHPEAVPYFDHAFVAWVTPIVAIGWFGGWLALVALAWALRRRRPDAVVLEIGVIALFAVGGGLLTYTLGAFTSNYFGAVGVSGFVVGLILLERRRVLAGAFTFIGIVYATTVAQLLGILPYAPMLTASPVEAHRIQVSWVLGFGQLTTAVELFGLSLIYFIVIRWRKREEELAATADQLVRANDLISRFVAAQVADQIRAGNYGAVERTDRRRLTIFFSDIRDFGSTADRIEPEELSEILNEYFHEMVQIAERYGGTVDKFMGDAIMIFFGAPLGPHEPDHAVRAVRMAMEMQHRMVELRQVWRERGIEEPFEIRIGINTGIANVGAFGAKGRMDYTAIGRQVNLAARLQVTCEPGRVLLSHATWALVKGEVDCVPKGELLLKGFHHPVRIYEVSDAFDPEAAPQAPVRSTG